MATSNSPKGNGSTFSTPAKSCPPELDPNESIISPRFLRANQTPRKQSTKKPLEYFEPNCSIIQPDNDDRRREPVFETPRKSPPSSLLLSQLSKNQAVVTENFLSCNLNQQTRVLRTEPKGRTYYTTVPMISSFSPKADTHNLLSSKSEVKSLIQEETSKEKIRIEQKLLAEIEANRKVIQELRERIMRDKRDACTCINESFAFDDKEALSDSIREFAEAHPLVERFAPVFFFIVLVYIIHLATEPLFDNGSWKYLYLLMVRIAAFLEVSIFSGLDS